MSTRQPSTNAQQARPPLPKVEKAGRHARLSGSADRDGDGLILYSDVPAHRLVPAALFEAEPTAAVLDSLRLLRATAGLGFCTEPPPFRTDAIPGVEVIRV
ncbi:MAG: hypothetical protein M0035_10225 [Actinomycetota bacterium]|nr:hypothetical protein [Actinomycetota bacterium]